MGIQNYIEHDSFQCVEKVEEATISRELHVSWTSIPDGRVGLSCARGVISEAQIPEMADLHFIPASAAVGTLRGFPSRMVFRQPYSSGFVQMFMQTIDLFL